MKIYSQFTHCEITRMLKRKRVCNAPCLRLKEYLEIDNDQDG